MNLSPEHIADLRRLVGELLPEAQIFAFGSRSKGTARSSSDLDLLVKAARPLTDLELSQLRERFSLSNLPFFVDVQDYFQVDPGFLRLIEGDLQAL